MFSLRRVVEMVGVVVLSVSAFAASPLEGNPWRIEITPEGATIPHYREASPGMVKRKEIP